jgi:CubicO group peptidase (beta-lactamase class C family)
MEPQPLQPRLVTAPIEAGAPPTQRMGLLAASLEELHARGEFNGSVLIAERGTVTFERHLGVEDVDGTIPLTRHSSFSLASVSKPFTALGIMLLARRGRLSLDDALAQHIPEFSYYEGITIRHLLHHTSGIPDHVELAEELWNPAFILPINDLLAMYEKYQPRRYFAPGDEFEYSNMGYVLLGELIARRSGQSFPEFMAAEIFRPLGMSDSAAFNLSIKECSLRCRAFGYRRHEGRRIRCDLNFLDGVFGDGGIYASAADLVRWDSGLREGALIPVEEYREAYVSGQLNNGNSTGYGFGWEIKPADVVDHWGQWEGFSAYVRRDLAKATLLVVLSNQGPPSEVDPICDELAGFVANL